MTAFLSIITLAAFAIPASIAVANWQKGGLGNYWHAFGWGVAAYVLFGFGAGFTYYYAIIKPAKADLREKAQTGPLAGEAQNAPKDRPELFMEGAKVESIAAGKNPQFKLVINNVGKATAYGMIVRAASSVLEADAPGPLLDYIAPEIGTGDPAGIQLLPPGEKQLFEQSWKHTFTEKEIEELNSKTKLLFFTGKATYEDVDGVTYESSFCYMFKNEPPFFLVNCPGKYWPQDFRKTKNGSRERRAWMNIEEIRMEGFEVGKYFTIVASSGNVGELPAVIKETRINVKFTESRVSYTRPMTLQDIDDADVRKPPGDSPVSAITPKQKINIPIVAGPLTAEMFAGVLSRKRFLVVWGGVEYETRGAVHYTAFCAFYDPAIQRFTTCGGGLD